jgi:hypothetical protein
MVAELDGLQSADEAASWAHRCLPAKNSLTIADADLVEAGRAKLAAFGDGRPADGLREAVQGLAEAQPVLPESQTERLPTGATAVPTHVASTGSGSGQPNHHPGGSIGGGIDKSVLAIGEPRR